ncbi:ABC transporter permease [Streptomyces arboris]|uniref:Transport permease protein n=1 Tax=Streptomyces arboris TaxID=2600619 RepID=A0A5N5ETH5_9ACTN|nr:ABC transporter permease [Streptomyces arboris]KAB2594328.1 ABC transporter permease [Streptomyces arboris]
MKTLRETLLVFDNQLRFTFRYKITIVLGMVQPVLYLLLFGPLLTKLGGVGSGNTWQTFVPGVLVYLALFGAGFCGFGIISDVRSGVIERMRVTPVSRFALLMGRVSREVAILLTQSVIIVSVGFLLGLRAGFLGILGAVVLVALLGIALASLSLSLGVALKSEDQFAPLLTSAALPVMLLAGILLPMDLAPKWLDYLSHLNPLRYIVDAIRDLFADQFATRAVLEGTCVAVVLAVVCVALGIRTFSKENA